MSTVKQCLVCGEEKTLDHFWKQRKAKDGKQSYCKGCHYEKNKSTRHLYAESDKQYRVKYKDRGRCLAYQQRYGITLKEYEEMEKKQEGRCAICEGKQKKKLHVDHCHTTGKVRGLLCNRCNLGIGQLGDTSETLIKAYTYIKEAEQ